MSLTIHGRRDDARLRIAAIRFLNPAPLMWDFEHPPQRDILATRYALQAMMPAECARQLAAGHTEIGLVPIAAYATIPDLVVIPGCTIASKGAIRSLLLVHREGAGLETVRTVAADLSSQATLAYVQILFRKYWPRKDRQVPVRFLSHAPDLDAMLQACDAAMLIGDPALIALEDRRAREQRMGERLVYLDLGREWLEATGVPWVSAFWAVRAESVTEARRSQVRQDFLLSRDNGLANIEALVREWTPRIALPEAVIRAYLRENIHYMLDEDCLAGVRRFFKDAEECGVLPESPPLRFL